MEALAEVAVFRIHLWFILLMAGALGLAITVAIVTAVIASRKRDH